MPLVRHPRTSATDADLAASLTDRVVLALRERLLRGEYRAGSRLTELGLVADVGASRTPVRHALVRLAHEGLLETLPRGGFRVRAFTVPEIWDAIEVRGVLEGTAARLAAERLDDPRDLDSLRALIARMDRLVQGDVDAFVQYLDLNDAFHAELRRLARSPMLMRALDVVLLLPFAAPGALVFSQAESVHSARASIIAQEHHRAIVEAIALREGTRAESLAREHARLARQNLARALGDRHLFNLLPGSSLITLPQSASFA